MTRRLIHLAALAAFLFLARSASADVIKPGGPKLSRSAKAAIKSAVVRDAKAFLSTQTKLSRPSYAVRNYQTTSTGHIEFDAAIRSVNVLWFPGAPTGATHRQRMDFFRAKFLISPMAQGQQVTLHPVQPWTAQPLPMASPQQ
jgi:hypothetical protein